MSGGVDDSDDSGSDEDSDEEGGGEGGGGNGGGGSAEDPIMEILEFLRLLCENHNLPLQNYLREQPDNLRSINIVAKVLHFLVTTQWANDFTDNTVEWAVDVSNIDVCVQAARTLVEVVQVNNVDMTYCPIMWHGAPMMLLY